MPQQPRLHIQHTNTHSLGGLHGGDERCMQTPSLPLPLPGKGHMKIVTSQIVSLNKF